MSAGPSVHASAALAGESLILQERRASARAASCSSSIAGPSRTIRRQQQRCEHAAAHAQLLSAAAERLSIAERDASYDVGTGSVPAGPCVVHDRAKPMAIPIPACAEFLLQSACNASRAMT